MCTWHQDALGRRSMIDFVVVSSDLQPHVLGTRVKRGAELSTDHHLVKELKYLGVLFMNEGRMEQEIDRRTLVVKRELSRKAKLSIYQSIFVPTLTYGHELWVMTERTKSRVQAAEMSFLRRVAGLSLRDRVRSSAIREELGVESLLLRVERSQMGWLGI
ncbi:hypothetical protein D4764_18G0002030 [Takifugu flavidus]|uniref:Uncharacterized protein n=1 Tax=Takifugu flavidus TaxID=433684 RepID=A0A5C6NUV7_9TELE|nr:hypothetical protein D4764_18G0002030 [Takifugu flavidus]